MSTDSLTAHGVFDVAEQAARLPETSDTMVADHRFTDDPAASARVFRVYHPTPPHSHASCDEYLYVLSGRCLMKFGDETPVEVGPGKLVFFKRGVVHSVPEILEQPMVFLSVDTPRREPRDIRFVTEGTGTPDTFMRQSGMSQSGMSQSGMSQSGMSQSGMSQSGMPQS